MLTTIVNKVKIFSDIKKMDDYCRVSIQKLKSSLPFILRLENSFKQYNFRFLAFRSTDFNLRRKTRFSASLAMEFKKQDKEILGKIETQEFSSEIKNFYSSGEWPSDGADTIGRIYLGSSEGLNLKIKNGTQIYYKDREITSRYGGGVILKIGDRLLDTQNANWDIIDNRRRIKSQISWDDFMLNLLYICHQNYKQLILL